MVFCTKGSDYKIEFSHLENKISLGLVDDGTWMTCLLGKCYKKSCNAGFDENTINSFNNLMCTHHQFTIRTTIVREQSDKVKIGDTITLEGKPNKFLDCSSEGGFCSTTPCEQQDEEGSNGAEKCSNHVFRIKSEGKKKGDIVQTHDIVQLEYVNNGHFLDCTGTKCLVHPCSEVTQIDMEMEEGQTKCKPPTFIIQK